MQEVRLRQTRRHREALRAVQGKAAAILERSQEGRRRSRRRSPGGNRWWENEEEIRTILPTLAKWFLMIAIIAYYGK